jgi:hypothetical protein
MASTNVNARPATKAYSEYNIERVWAQHGAVFIMLKGGDVRTFQPEDATVLLRQLNLSLPDKGSARKEVLRFIEAVIPAIREAMKQVESPGDSATAAVVSAIRSGDTWRQDTTPGEGSFVAKVALRLPLMDEDEVRSVFRGLSAKGKSENYIAGFLHSLHAERMQEFEKTGRLPAML